MKINRIFNFVLFSNLFIGLVAIVMCYLTVRVFELDVTPAFYFIIYFATLCSYCLHWYLTPGITPSSVRVEWTHQNKRILLGIFVISLAGLLTALYYHLEMLFYIFPAAVMTFVYTSPKIPFKPFTHLQGMLIPKTIYLSIIWTYVTSVLPLLITGTNLNQEQWLFIMNRFLFIHIVSIAFDFRDRDEDEGFISITRYLSEKQLFRVLFALTALFILSLVLLYQHLPSSVLIVSIGFPFILLFLTRKIYVRSNSDYLYYGFLDGVLMLPTLLYYLFVFISG
jgi:hypothetical protein